MKKKVVFTMVILLFMQYCVSVIASNPPTPPPPPGPPATCSWEKTSCPGFFGTSREICVTSGNGNSCSCGEVTRNCK